MAVGDNGEAKALHALSRIRTKYPEHRIFPFRPAVSNTPYDIGIDIDGEYYRVQVKTTSMVTSEGRMIFDTSRSEKGPDGKSRRVPYSKEDISFFFLYCDDEKEGEWLGIGLLEECNMSTTVCKYGKLFKDSRRACDMDFEKRIRELIEEKEIAPIPGYSTTEIIEEPEEEPPAPVFHRPETDSELFNLLAEYDYDLEALSDSIRVSVPTIQSWIREYA